MCCAAPAIYSNLPAPCVVWTLRNCCAPCCPRMSCLSPAAPGRAVAPGDTKGPWGMFSSKRCYELSSRDELNWADKFPLCTAVALVEMLERLQRDAHTLRCPFSILHGKDDGAVLVAGSEMMRDRAEYALAEVSAGRPNPVVLLEGYRHSLRSDWCSEPIRDFIVDWCCGKLEINST